MLLIAPRRQPKTLALALPLVMALYSVACGPPAQHSAQLTPDGGREITAEQIAQMHVSTAWDVLERIGAVRLAQSADGRSATMQSRRGKNSLYLSQAGVPLLYVDGVRVDDPRALRQISAESIGLLRLVSGIQATVQEGTNAGAGMIVIQTKTAPDTT